MRNGDTVTVNEHNGEYLARILSTDEFEDQDGNQLFGVKVVELMDPPEYSLEEGETCNVYPSDCSPSPD